MSFGSSSIQVTFTPAVIGTYEQYEIARLAAGDRVLWAVAKKVVLADADTRSTITLGDKEDDDGYLTGGYIDEPNEESDEPVAGDLDLETGTVGDIVDGTGVYFNRSGGKLYTEADVLLATYTPGPVSDDYGATIPSIKFYVALVRDTVH